MIMFSPAVVKYIYRYVLGQVFLNQSSIWNNSMYIRR